MALESATYISDLNSSNPTAGDPASQGDDHLRLVKSTVKATFPNVSGAVTPTHTELNYVDGVTSSIQTQLDKATLTNGNAASASGTSVDFTSIPSWVKRITVTFAGISTNGTALPIIQIGDSGGVEATGYLGSVAYFVAGGAVTGARPTAGFGLSALFAATSVIHGSVTLTLVNSATYTWAASGNLGFSDADVIAVTAGSKSLIATLDRVRITTVGGVNTFDAGTINIQYD